MPLGTLLGGYYDQNRRNGIAFLILTSVAGGLVFELDDTK